MYFRYMCNIIRSSISYLVLALDLYPEPVGDTTLARIPLASDGEMVLVTAVQLLVAVVGAVVDSTVEVTTALPETVLGVAGVKVTVVGAAKDVVAFVVPLVTTVELRPGRAASANASC